MIDWRGGIIAVTICIFIALVNDAPKPVKDNQVPYCQITYKAVGKDMFGKKRIGWAQGYGPCSLLDRYENI